MMRSLHRRLQIGLHRQADHFFGQLLADWQPAVGYRKASIGGLAIQRLGVIDGGRDAWALNAAASASRLCAVATVYPLRATSQNSRWCGMKGAAN